MRIAIGLEYAGSAFTGWQSQPDGRGVQDALERALAAVADAPVRAIAAGRTDAGVHATMQVVHLDVDVTRPDTAWVRGVNAHLPAAVAVLWARAVAPDFHARNAARMRTYTYLLANRPVRPALLAGRVGWYHQPLDVGAMTEGASALVGTHDFSAFRAAECQAKSPTKTMTEATIAQNGELLRFDFRADAFLQHMIRNIVGSLVYVGAGKRRPAWIGDLLAARDRKRAAPTFAPDGLYFTGVDYDPCWGLPSTQRPVAVPRG
ncbi:MAG TPA: tRNA pseudouridine(38-40) synthase TruA [Casimicrobiaceae bacterium]|nr:tRNA pseudouridine(38-40) synthase TruA [Casimicrobiaceae bacterium]